MDGVFKLNPAVQKYAWGKVGSESEVARLFSANSGQPVDENCPYAELWMGTHKKGPSVIASPGQFNGLLLSEWISQNQWALGENVAKAFDGKLPYLLKVLSINKSLSIQAHPTKQHAIELHSSKPEHYPDGNHKPELAIAITFFLGMCGFRPFCEIVKYLETVPELASVVGVDACERMKAAESGNADLQKSALKFCFTALISCSPEVIGTELSKLVGRISTANQRGQRVVGIEGDLVCKLHEQFPGDVGCFCVFFLNSVQLLPGEAMFLAPNEPHAYLMGDCVECMACSDNVVRAGLTPKYKDKQTLCDMLTYECRPSAGNSFRPRQHPNNPFAVVYDTPVADFTVAKLSAPPGVPPMRCSIPVVNGPSIILVQRGCAEIVGPQFSETVSSGTVLFVAAGRSLNVAATTDGVTLFQAYCH